MSKAEKTTQEKCDEAAMVWVAMQIVTNDIKELHKRNNRAVKTLNSLIKALEKTLEQAKNTLNFIESEWDD